MVKKVPSLPTAKVIQVDTRGAVILVEESPDVSVSSNYIEPISHIAIDVSLTFLSTGEALIHPNGSRLEDRSPK